MLKSSILANKPFWAFLSLKKIIMSLVCDCTNLPAALADIPNQTCQKNERIGQIVRLAFQRVQPSGAPTFTEANIGLEATWTPLLAAIDSTKIVLSPLLTNAVIANTEAQTTGGNDNTTVKGVPVYFGEGFGSFTSVLQDASKEVKDALAALACETFTSIPQVTVYFFSEFNRVFAADLSPTDVRGFELVNLRVGGTGTEGKNSVTTTPLDLTLPQVGERPWDCDGKLFALDFDPCKL